MILIFLAIDSSLQMKASENLSCDAFVCEPSGRLSISFEHLVHIYLGISWQILDDVEANGLDVAGVCG